jgi:PAS domain S-box-containing protein/putative nucleotidyltransferase with HDIG domain
MAVLDADRRFVEVNQSFSALLGFGRRDVVGRRPDELNLWVNGSDCAALSASVARDGNHRGAEVALRTKGGPERVGLLSAVNMEMQGASCTLATFLDITDRKAAELELQRSHHELEQAYESTLRGWARALELRDAETEGHSQRVTDLTVSMARLAGIPEPDLVQVRRGALLHDIGKMGIPDGILLKAGPLTDDEWAVMRKHPTFARDLLSSIDFLTPALEIPYCHHEKWDGSGYPCGLAGESIPLPARLFAVVDVWDALASHRPYKDPWPADRIHEHIHALAGSHFDPQAVSVFERAVSLSAEEAA